MHMFLILPEIKKNMVNKLIVLVSPAAKEQSKPNNLAGTGAEVSASFNRNRSPVSKLGSGLTEAKTASELSVAGFPAKFQTFAGYFMKLQQIFPLRRSRSQKKIIRFR